MIDKNHKEDQQRSLQKMLNVASSSFNIQKPKDDRSEQNDQKEIIRRLRIQNKKLQEQLATLRKKNKQHKTERTALISEMNVRIQLNQLLSRALGSCSECWGQDPGCSTCLGEGIAGWKKINKRLFNVYVLPALEKLYGLGKKIR